MLPIGCATGEATAIHQFQAVFGITEYSPLSLSPGPLPDFVRGGPQAVATAIRSCGGRSLHYEEMTDGAAVIDFSTAASLAEIQSCVRQSLPQVSIGATTDSGPAEDPSPVSP